MTYYIATMYSADAISNYFLKKGKSEGEDITILKLLKLLFLAYGHYLAMNEKKLFSEKIYAWKYGPVVKEVYDKYKYCGNRPLQNIDEFNFESIPSVLSSDVTSFLDLVWNAYIQFEAYKLVQITHMPGSPWAEVTNNGTSVGRDIVIPSESIKIYFTEMARKAQAQAQAQAQA